MTNWVKIINRQLYCYFFADRIIGKYPQIKAKENRVNLFDYHPELENDNRYNNSRYNLGDYLGFFIVEAMLKRKGLTIDSWVPKRRHMNSVGSNIFSSYQHTTIWGSGVHHDPYTILKYLCYYPLRRLDIRAVRGPLSREVLLRYGHKCPEIYGDPAILMPLFYQPQVSFPPNEILVIPQYLTEKTFRIEHPELKMVSMNTNDYKQVIDAIASSKKVITSSLHAIILADSYGVPSVLFRGLGKKVDFKYLDYYASTGRYNIHIADSFEEAYQMKPLPLPDLKPLQNGLMNAFPYDLWDRA